MSDGPLPWLAHNAGSTLLVLVRHAQTAWNLERRFQGQLDVPLSDEGYRQADAIADWIPQLPIHFSAIYSSDLRRAADTAQRIASKLDLSPVYAPELRELYAGDWQGLLVAEVEAQYPGALLRWREDVANVRLPGGEGVLDVQRRISRYIEEVVQRHRGEAVIVVSHGAALTALVAHLNGWDLQETWDTRRARMSNTGVTVIAFPTSGEEPRTLLLNSVAHLPAQNDLASVIDPDQAVDKEKPPAEYAV